jgi:c-di-GMP-binding flagellar brake protein YcgR
MGEERRRHKRIETTVRITCKPIGLTFEEDIYSFDISTGGFRIGYPKVVKPDTVFELNVYLPDKQDSFFCLAKVIWQKPKPKRGKSGKEYYETGLKFEDMDLKNRLRLIYYIHNFDKNERKKSK